MLNEFRDSLQDVKTIDFIEGKYLLRVVSAGNMGVIVGKETQEEFIRICLHLEILAATPTTFRWKYCIVEDKLDVAERSKYVGKRFFSNVDLYVLRSGDYNTFGIVTSPIRFRQLMKIAGSKKVHAQIEDMSFNISANDRGVDRAIINQLLVNYKINATPLVGREFYASVVKVQKWYDLKSVEMIENQESKETRLKYGILDQSADFASYSFQNWMLDNIQN